MDTTRTLIARSMAARTANLAVREALKHNLARAIGLAAKCRETWAEYVKLGAQRVKSAGTLRLNKNKHQPTLRLVINRDDRFDVPRKYDQSTSGRTDSTGTRPPLSRSSAMAVDSAIRCLADIAFRKYPTVVPQRLAYSSCSSGAKVFKYKRRTSALMGSSNGISPTLPDSKVIPLVVGNSLRMRRSHNERMTLADTRRRRLRLLISEFGSQKAVADACGFESDNYLSQLLTPSKPFGEKAARKIEAGTRKPEKWLDSDDAEDHSQGGQWVFSFDRALWDRLPASKKLALENSFQQLVLGASVQEAAAPSSKKRPA